MPWLICSATASVSASRVSIFFPHRRADAGTGRCRSTRSTRRRSSDTRTAVRVLVRSNATRRQASTFGGRSGDRPDHSNCANRRSSAWHHRRGSLGVDGDGGAGARSNSSRERTTIRPSGSFTAYASTMSPFCSRNVCTGLESVNDLSRLPCHCIHDTIARRVRQAPPRRPDGRRPQRRARVR